MTTHAPLVALPGGDTPGRPPARWTLDAYVMAVFGLGLVCLVAVLARQLPADGWTAHERVGCAVLTILLIASELRPLEILRGDEETDRITASSTFATALVLVGPLGLAMAAQALAVAVDDLWGRRPRRLVAFNVGQYLLTLAAARLVFSTTSGHPFLALSSPMTAADLLPALAAGVAYFVVNNGLVAIAVGLDRGTSPLAVFVEDIKVQGATSTILLGLAPVAAVLAFFAPVMLLLLLLPILGVHYNAQLVLRRQHEALHDPLTGLPNRELLRRRLARRLGEDSGTGVAVMIIDLDHFKEINDTLGHHVGDQVISEVAARLVGFLPAGVSVARLGGDEFAVLCPQVSGVLEAEALGASVCTFLQQPVLIDQVRLAVAASVGVAVAPDHADSVETLLKRADIALYRAKAWRGESRVYGSDIDGHSLERLALLSDLHTGVDNDEFTLFFQPVIAASTGRVVGVEALMRWCHPRQGMVPPDVFIPLAENTNVITDLTRLAVARAAQGLATWQSLGYDLSASVNLSARLLSDLDLPDWVADILAENHVPPGRMTIEVTESTVMSDPKRAVDILNRLRGMGLTIAIDDYGTGYSSLAYLRKLAVQELKIDKSFVQQMATSENSATIVQSTIELAHNLGLTVTAEGVEDDHAVRVLTGLGCDHLQGFRFSRPVPLDALTGWLGSQELLARGAVG